MAKNSDQRAGGFETENTGGVLSGLLADEEHFDRRAMFRLGTWGVASVGAVIVAVLANQTGMKLHHEEVAALDLARQSQQIQSVAKESQNETRRLVSAIDTLNGDRDRMYSRLTAVEQGLESVTGAIARQNTAAPPPPAVTPPAATLVGPPAPTSALAPASALQPVAQTAAPEPAPTVAPVTTTATATPAPEKPAPDKPRAEAKKPALPAPMTAAAATPAPPPPNPPAATSAEPLMASKSFMAPPDAAAAKLIEPEPAAKTAAVTPPSASPAPAPAPAMGPPAPAPSPAPEVAASTPPADKLAAAEPAPSAPPPLAVKRTEFGVDVGGANSVGGLRALWQGLLKSRSNAPLSALQPIIVVKERDNGLGMQLRLVAGPLGDAAAAAKICAKIAENGRPCETTVFDGQRLAVKAEGGPATTESVAKSSSEKSSSEKPSDPASEKSASDRSSARPGFARQGSHRRGYSYSRRAPVEQAPQPPPQQASTLSWFRRSQ